MRQRIALATVHKRFAGNVSLLLEPAAEQSLLIGLKFLSETPNGGG
jgi:hypothetical protein